MSFEKLSDAAAAATIWSIIADVAKERKDEARAFLTGRMSDDVAAVKAIANGHNVGRANWVDGKTSVVVADVERFTDYVAAKFPTEIVKSVNSAFKSALLAKVTFVGDIAIDENGEPVPGVELREGSPYVSISKSKQAREIVEELLSAGRVGIGGLMPRELPPAES